MLYTAIAHRAAPLCRPNDRSPILFFEVIALAKPMPGDGEKLLVNRVYLARFMAVLPHSWDWFADGITQHDRKESAATLSVNNNHSTKGQQLCLRLQILIRYLNESILFFLFHERYEKPKQLAKTTISSEVTFEMNKISRQTELASKRL